MFLLDFHGKQPICDQIKDQIIRFVNAGVLAPGDRLPSVRQLAVDNGVNPNTVAKAYSRLEEMGIVYNLPRKGVYVAGVNDADKVGNDVLTLFKSLKENGVKRETLESAIRELYGEDENAGN